MSSKQSTAKTFAARTFAWLRQINRGKYLAIDVKVAVELTEYFTEKDQGGRAYPGYKTIGDAIGVSEQTAIRSIDRLRNGGDLYVIPGKPGRGYPNQYWMILKDAPKTSAVKEVLESQKTSIRDSQKTSIRDNKTSIAVEENHLRTTLERKCYALPSPGERETFAVANDSSPPGGDPPANAGPRQERPQSTEVQIKPESPIERSHPVERATERSFAALRALWARGWPVDDSPKAIAVQRAAFAKACTVAEPEEILAGARVHVAAADAPRFLPPLAEWLAGRGWEKPPPTKPKRSHNGARHPRRKADIVEIGLALAREYAAERAAS